MLKSYSLWLVCGISVLYAAAGPVQAGAVVELRYADLTGAPIEVPSQGFSPGDQFLVELWLKPDQTFVARQIAVDYRASSPELIPGFGLDIDTVNQSPDGIPNFWFDYTGAGFGTYPANGYIEPIPGLTASTAANYIDFSNLRVGDVKGPVGTVAFDFRPSTNMKSFTGGVFNRVGGMPVTIPNDISPGIFNVDLLNPPDSNIDDYNEGSSITFGFGLDAGDPTTMLSTATFNNSFLHGPLGYALGAGPLAVPVLVGQVVPEPASILLFACGMGFVMRSIKRRNSFA